MTKYYFTRCLSYGWHKSVSSSLNWAGTIGVATLFTIKHYGGIEFSFPDNELGLIVSSLLYTLLALLIFFVPRFLYALIILKQPQEILFGNEDGFYIYETHSKVNWHKLNIAIFNKEIQPLLDCRVIVENADSEGNIYRRCPLSSFDVLPSSKKFVQIADYKEWIDEIERGEFTITLNSSGKSGFSSYQDSLSEKTKNQITIILESQGRVVLEQQCHIWVENKHLHLIAA